VELRAMSAEALGGPEKGYADLTEFGSVELSESTFTLAPGEERMVRGTIALTAGKPIKCKSLMCMIAAAVTDQPVRTQICTRVYVHLR
jgi:hypothetical protein